MEFVGWQHTKCGYINQERLECPTCGSALIYDNEEKCKCTYCKKTIDRYDMYEKVKCNGCKKKPSYSSDISFIPAR